MTQTLIQGVIFTEEETKELEGKLPFLLHDKFSESYKKIDSALELTKCFQIARKNLSLILDKVSSVLKEKVILLVNPAEFKELFSLVFQLERAPSYSKHSYENKIQYLVSDDKQRILDLVLWYSELKKEETGFMFNITPDSRYF